MQSIWARTALLADGWAQSVRIDIAADGHISDCRANAPPQGCETFATLLPAPVNLHSHGFQRAMAGLSEARGAGEQDSFWTWRDLMFRFLDHLSPDDVQAITALAQIEMLEAGFAAACEFHYLHHQPGGAPYDNPAEMADSIAAAASATGIGLTMLPVFYQYGGLDQRALSAGQIRFGNTPDQFAALVDATQRTFSGLPGDTGFGIAPHSLRAVSQAGLDFAAGLRPGAPMHIHVAEQTGEVDEVFAHYGARPVTWLLDNQDISDRWCFIHATQMTADETTAMARSGAVAGLCPVTESSLGDGIFDGERFFLAGGRFGVGTDSNICISLAQELRGIEYSQRLHLRRRAVMATAEKSSGRLLFDQACASGARVAGRKSGQIASGYLADMLALRAGDLDLAGLPGDAVLDDFVFAGGDRMISDVWSAGRHLVRDGAHIHRPAIRAAWQKTLARLLEKL